MSIEVGCGWTLPSKMVEVITDWYHNRQGFYWEKNLVQSSKHFLSCNNLMTSVAKFSTTSSGHWATESITVCSLWLERWSSPHAAQSVNKPACACTFGFIDGYCKLTWMFILCSRRLWWESVYCQHLEDWQLNTCNSGLHCPSDLYQISSASFWMI